MSVPGVRTCAALLLLLACAVGRCAAGAARPPYTLVELESLLEQSDEGVEAALYDLEAARAALAEAGRYSCPELYASYRFYPNSGSITDDELTTNHSLSVGVRQDLIQYLAGRGPRRDAAAGDLAGAEQARRAAVNEALYDLRVLYWEMTADQLAAQHAAELEDVYQHMRGILEQRVRSHDALPLDLIECEQAIEDARTGRDLHIRGVQSARELLAGALHVEPADVQPCLDEVCPALPPYAKLADAAAENSPDVARLRALARRERALTAADSYEDWHLWGFVEYDVRNADALGTQTGPAVGFSFSVPLCAGGLRRARESRRLAGEAAWLARARQEARRLERELARACQEWRLQDGRVRTLQAKIEARQEALRVEQLRLDAPLVSPEQDPTAPLRVQAEVATLRGELDAARCEQARAYYAALYLAGVPRPECAPTGAGAPAPAERALWVWKVRDLLRQPDGPEGLLSACRRLGVGTVYLGFGRELREEPGGPADLAALMTALHGEGIRISALVGDPLWTLPKHRAGLTDAVETVLAHNAQAPEAARFDALHLDIEPQALDAWAGDARAALVAQLADACEAARARLLAAPNPLPLEVDVPTSYDAVAPEALARIVHAARTVVVMAYGTTDLDRLTDAVDEDLRLAAGSATGVVVGLRAGDWPSRDALTRALDALAERLGPRAAFRGTAIHDYAGWRELTEGTPDATTDQ